MYDLLPFPNVLSKTSEEQIDELINYLIQFKEALEFILTNIGVDNLSPELVKKLSLIGVPTHNEDEVSQITNKILTVSDVIESPLFETAVKNVMSNT